MEGKAFLGIKSNQSVRHTDTTYALLLSSEDCQTKIFWKASPASFLPIIGQRDTINAPYSTNGPEYDVLCLLASSQSTLCWIGPESNHLVVAVPLDVHKDAVYIYSFVENLPPISFNKLIIDWKSTNPVTCFRLAIDLSNGSTKMTLTKGGAQGTTTEVVVGFREKDSKQGKRSVKTLVAADPKEKKAVLQPYSDHVPESIRDHALHDVPVDVSLLLLRLSPPPQFKLEILKEAVQDWWAIVNNECNDEVI